jgi:DMSO/TMAO reductase YedYZ molybdopterin-dependent catalytic subunit
MQKMVRLTQTGNTGSTNRIGRREFLFAGLVSGGSLVSSHLLDQGRFLLGQTATVQAAPQALGELLTSNSDFFIRNHFATPRINAETWNLEISGLVGMPRKLGYPDILLASSARHSFTIECAGNRSGGAGVSTARWSGLPLAQLLKQARIRSEATTVVFHGADSGEVENLPATHFARAIPLEKAMDRSTLLAYEMNGAPLPAEHGFPLRAVVPGWYGMDSVKWLTRIEVLGQSFEGYFQKEEYMAVKGNGERQPVTRMRVNSKFLRPSEDEEIRAKKYVVEGVAWAGERKIAQVEIRIGPGGAWQPATLAALPLAMVWTPWKYDWNVTRPGPYTLEVRTTDEDGNTQPDVRDPDRKDFYELNTPARVNVHVRP